MKNENKVISENSLQEISSKSTTIKELINIMMDENFKLSMEAESSNISLYLKNESVYLDILSDYIDVISKEAEDLLKDLI